MPDDSRHKREGQIVKLLLSPEAAEVLPQLAGSPRKLGEYVSQLIMDAARKAEAERIAQLEQELNRLRGGASEVSK